MDGMPAQERLALAVADMAAGRPQAALPTLRALALAHPGEPMLMLNLGMALMDSGALAEAKEALTQAGRLVPRHPEPSFRLARLAHLRGDLDQAHALYEAALARQPGHVPALGGLAELARSAGQPAIAVSLLREALLHDPAEESLQVALVKALLACGDAEGAEVALRPVISAPRAAGRAGVAWAEVLLAAHAPEEARKQGEAEVRAHPLCAMRAAALACLLDSGGRGSAALNAWRAAEAIAPDDPDILAGLAESMSRHREHVAAVDAFDRAIALAPTERSLHIGRASQLWRLNRFGEAQAALNAVLEDFGDNGRARGTLALVLLSQGRQDEALREASRADIENRLLLELSGIGPYHPESGRAEALAAAGHGLHAHLSEFLLPSFNPPARADRERLRVGLLSAHLGRHPVGWLTLAGFEHLPRDAFELQAFSLTEREGDLAARYRERMDVWHALEPATPDVVLIRTLRAAELDILIDLGGHGQGGRVRALAHRAAAVQIKWVGAQAATTGVPNLDWMLTDRWETPAGFEAYYTERLLRMPDGYVCYTPPNPAPPVAPAPALARGAVTFGCYNNLAKVTQGTLACWGRILKALPDSRLVLRTHAFGDPPTRETFVQRAAAAGIDVSRLETHGPLPHHDLLAAYGEIDISLDPFPYTGGLTVCESLWMGVPVLTLVGTSFAGRHAFSHLSNVGLADWTVHSEDDYVAEAIRRAQDVPALAGLRAGLRERVAASPLCDGPRFGANLAAALRHAWEERPRSA